MATAIMMPIAQLDVGGRRLVVHRNPVDGEYRSTTVYGEDESVATLARLDEGILVSALL
ncbi:MAG: hypothetical protein QM813_00695 [Verrucomicrobiota bacterium]